MTNNVCSLYNVKAEYNCNDMSWLDFDKHGNRIRVRVGHYSRTGIRKQVFQKPSV